MIIFKYGSSMQRDPYVIFYQDYYYYVCARNGNEIYIGKTKNILDLENTTFECVYKAPENTMYSKELWAPELHIIDDKCYIYVACDNGDNNTHRMYVLENNSSNPLDIYKMHGQITDSTDKWAIDGTVFKYKNQLYFSWSGWETDENVMQQIYIAKMEDPFTISSKRVSISKPTYSWELHGGTPLVNEGPAALIHNDDLFLTYSASGCWTNNYCIGLLKLNGADLLNKDNWIKYDKPLVEATSTLKGPGHNSFTKINNDDYIIFHAFNNDASEGGHSVNVHIKKINWVNNLPVIE